MTDTRALPNGQAWREITDYKLGSGSTGWHMWDEIVRLGNPVPYKPEEEQ